MKIVCDRHIERRRSHNSTDFNLQHVMEREKEKVLNKKTLIVKSYIKSGIFKYIFSTTSTNLFFQNLVLEELLILLCFQKD